MVQRRDVILIIVSLLVGPPIASVLYLFFTAMLRLGVAGAQALDLELLLAMFPFFYLIAWPALLATAIGNAVVARWVKGERSRLLVSLPIGALALMVLLHWLTTDDAGQNADLALLACLAAAGAIASLVSVALVEAFNVRLRSDA
jgi:hypothetical protein